MEEEKNISMEQADYGLIYPSGAIVFVNVERDSQNAAVSGISWQGKTHGHIQPDAKKYYQQCGDHTIETSVVILPEEIDGHRLTKIKAWAFSGWEDLSYIRLPKTISCIEECAFYGCSGLNHIKLPSSVKHLGNSAFAFCAQLESIRIPSSITHLPHDVFMGCGHLREVSIPASVKRIDANAFSACPKLSSIIVSNKNKVFDSRDNCNAIIETNSDTLICGCKSTLIPNTVKIIHQGAFDGCDELYDIAFPNSIEEIQLSAFGDCKNLQRISIPESVSDIDWSSFWGCSNISSIVVHPDNRYYHSPNNCNAIIRTRDNVLIIGCCKTIIPDNITEIGEWAFSNSNLNEIVFPESLITIGDQAFQDCRNLQEISIPRGTAQISSDAFNGCSRLSTIRVDKKNPYYDSRMNCNAIIHTGTNTLIRGCWQTRIPDSVARIGFRAFSDCPCLISITIPDSVAVIEDAAFSKCENLVDIRLPKFLTHIGDSAFNGCSGLTAIEIPNTVIEIGDAAFYECISLTEIEIPPSVTTIGQHIFSGCSKLKKVIVPRRTLIDGIYLPDGVEVVLKRRTKTFTFIKNLK